MKVDEAKSSLRDEPEDDPWVRWLWESQRFGAGAVRQIVSAFPNPEDFFSKSWRFVTSCLYPYPLTRQVLDRLRDLHACQVMQVQPRRFSFLSYRHRKFPASLFNLHDPPCGLYWQGDLTHLERSLPSLSIVGTRYPSRYALIATQDLIDEIAPFNPLIISGMARGIDGVAHQKALQYGLSTIAILGTGLDQVYPREHQTLFEQIGNAGLLLSETPPGVPLSKYLFPQRNRLIAALCDALVVAEAPEKSGALLTAEFALDLGKPIFVIPGPWKDRNKGGHRWIQQGAQLLVEPKDIPRFLNWDSFMQVPVFQQRESNDYPKTGRQIVSLLLKEGPLHIDNLLTLSQIPAPHLMALLSELTLTGILIELPGKIFEIAK